MKRAVKKVLVHAEAGHGTWGGQAVALLLLGEGLLSCGRPVLSDWVLLLVL